MKFKKLLVGVLGVAMSVTLLAGCGGDKGKTGSASKDIVINLQTEPKTLNSIKATGSIDGNVLRQCMEGLVVLDENDKPEPGVAKEWKVSDDKLTVTFKLRDNAVWSNGEKVTAHDFVFALDQLFYLKNGAEYAGTWAPLIEGASNILKQKDKAGWEKAKKNAGYKALDDYTLEFKLTGPYDYFVGLTAYQSFFPVNEKGFNDAGGYDKYATEADKIVTNGAFNLTSWTHQDNIVLEKNDKYWDADNIKIDKCTMRMITDTNTIMNEFKAGNLDMAGFTGEQTQQLKKEGTEMLQYDDGGNFYLEFNTKEKGLNNAKVRKALTIGMGAEGFVKSILQNDSYVATSFTPKAIAQGEFKKAVGDLIERPANNDYTETKKLLEEGLREEGLTLETFKITMIADEGDSVARMCAYVQEQLKQNLGVKMEINQLTYKARLQAMTDKQFSVVMSGWGPDYNDPMTFMDLWVTDGGNNHTSWSNAKYDKLIEDARKEADTAKRTQLLVDAEKLLMEEMPVGPIYCRVRDYAVSPKLKGMLRTAFQDIDITGCYIEG